MDIAEIIKQIENPALHGNVKLDQNDQNIVARKGNKLVTWIRTALGMGSNAHTIAALKEAVRNSEYGKLDGWEHIVDKYAGKHTPLTGAKINKIVDEMRKNVEVNLAINEINDMRNKLGDPGLTVMKQEYPRTALDLVEETLRYALSDHKKGVFKNIIDSLKDTSQEFKEPSVLRQMKRSDALKILKIIKDEFTLAENTILNGAGLSAKQRSDSYYEETNNQIFTYVALGKAFEKAKHPGLENEISEKIQEKLVDDVKLAIQNAIESEKYNYVSLARQQEIRTQIVDAFVKTYVEKLSKTKPEETKTPPPKVQFNEHEDVTIFRKENPILGKNEYKEPIDEEDLMRTKKSSMRKI